MPGGRDCLLLGGGADWTEFIDWHIAVTKYGNCWQDLEEVVL